MHGSSTDQDTPASEIKFVTVWRADLVASTELVADLGPEEAMLRLEPALAVMRAAVRRHGGIVCREMGDGILAVFGAPVAKDDHAVAAAYAGFALLADIRALHGAPAVRVGIHSGSVMTHHVSTEYSSVYDVGGPALNLVERLQACAEPGGICVSSECATLCGGFVEFEPLPPRALKGFRGEVALFRARAIGEPARWRVRAAQALSPFTGREPELRELRGAARATPRGAVRLGWLSGEAGIGKSRLAHELAARLRAEGWRTIEVHCSPLHARSPHAALRALFAATVGDDPAGDLPIGLRTAVDAVLNRPFTDSAWQAMEPRQRQRAIAAACGALVDAAARDAPLLLLVEDLHWLDQASEAVLRELPGRMHPGQAIFLLVTSRDDATAPGLDEQARLRLRLGALEAGDSGVLLDALLEGPAASPALKERVLRHTGAVPLFIEEVCRQLRETGALAAGGAEPLSLQVPVTVQGVIAARIDRLAPGGKALLQSASVLGPDWKVSLLEAVAELAPPPMWQAIESLVAAGMLAPADAYAETFTFSHDLVRQVAYESMLGSARKTRHAQALAALEQAGGVAPETLCHHARCCGDWERAFGHARAVVRRCIDRSALADGVVHANLALEAIERLPPSVERERDAVDFRLEARGLMGGAGHIDRMLVLAGEAIERAQALGDALRSVHARAVRQAALNFHGSAAQALSEGERVLAQALALGDTAWLNYVRYGLGQAQYMAGRYRSSIETLDLVHRQLSSAKPQVIAATTVTDLHLITCMMLTLSCAALGDVVEAERFEHHTAELAARSARSYGHVAASYGRGVRLLAAGETASARAVLEGTLEIARRHDVGLFAPLAGCQLGIACMREGAVETAAAHLLAARTHAQAIRHRSAFLRSSLNLADALFQCGRAAAAWRLARRTTRLCAAEGYAGMEAESLVVEARILHAEDVPRRRLAALSRLHAAIDIATRHEARPVLAQARAALRPLQGTVD